MMRWLGEKDGSTLGRQVAAWARSLSSSKVGHETLAGCGKTHQARGGNVGRAEDVQFETQRARVEWEWHTAPELKCTPLVDEQRLRISWSLWNVTARRACCLPRSMRLFSPSIPFMIKIARAIMLAEKTLLHFLQCMSPHSDGREHATAAQFGEAWEECLNLATSDAPSSEGEGSGNVPKPSVRNV